MGGGSTPIWDRQRALVVLYEAQTSCIFLRLYRIPESMCECTDKLVQRLQNECFTLCFKFCISKLATKNLNIAAKISRALSREKAHHELEADSRVFPLTYQPASHTLTFSAAWPYDRFITHETGKVEH